MECPAQTQAEPAREEPGGFNDNEETARGRPHRARSPAGYPATCGAPASAMVYRGNFAEAVDDEGVALRIDVPSHLKATRL